MVTIIVTKVNSVTAESCMLFYRRERRMSKDNFQRVMSCGISN
jgi:hypothetical protein